MNPIPDSPRSRPLLEDDWSTLFEGLPVGAFRSLPNGRFVRVNTALARMHGFDTEAELVAHVSDLAVDWFVRPERRREILDQLDREGSARALVSEIYHQKTRERMWISENSYVIRDAQGQVLFYEGTVEEVTQRVHAYEALEHSEALLRNVTTGVPGVVYRMRVTAALRQYYEFVSDGVRTLYGVEPEAVLADPGLLGALRDPQDEERVQAVFRDHVASGRPTSVEFRICPQPGSSKWVRLTSTIARRDDADAVLHGVVIDISAARDVEQALLDSDRRWKAALDCLGDGVWDWDLSRDDCVMTGPLSGGYDTPVGSPCEGLCEPGGVIHPDDLPDMLATRQAHIDGSTPTYVHEHRIRQRDGGWLWVQSRGVVVERDPQGRALRMIGTHTDITERREADALRQQRDRAEAADRAKSELMSRISHELRTPLNAILGFAQLLDLDTVPGSAQHEWSHHVLQSGRLLLGLVDDVLDLTHGQSMQFTLDIVPTNLLEAFQHSWALLAAQAAAARITLGEVTVDPALAVRADPKRLRQVLNNLLSNAVKYNQEDGRITFDARTQGEQVVFSIADTGQGIGPEFLARVFQPFDRLGAAHGKVPGTGLGLALCRQLVEAMGGTITVASEAGVGTCFTVCLGAAGPAPVNDPEPPTEPHPR